MLVYGDTNSTLAGALAAAKLHIPVAHVEAGLRSFNRAMPEEINRVVTDHLSDLLFCPTPTAVDNLAAEGIRSGVHLVGDVMFDASPVLSRDCSSRAASKARPARWPSRQISTCSPCTGRRTPTTRLASGRSSDALNDLDEYPGSSPCTPARARCWPARACGWRRHIQAIEPVGFLEMLAPGESLPLRRHRLRRRAEGGASSPGKPCITLRDQTEWVETVQSGWNTLVGADPQKIRAAFGHASHPRRAPCISTESGDAGSKILSILIGG